MANETKSIDTPVCCKCGERLSLNGEFGHLPTDDISGATETVGCPSCRKLQKVSPSIEWLSWTDNETRGNVR